MTTKANNFEGGTDATALTTANSGGTSGDAFTTATVSGTGVKNYQASGALKGSRSLRLTAANSTDTAIVGWDSLFSGVSGTGLTLRFYIYFYADTAANGANILQIRHSAGAAATLTMNTGLSLRLINNASAVVTGTTLTLSLNTLYRVEINLDPGTSTSTGAVKYAVYAGDSTTALVSTTQSAQNFFGSTITGLRFGKTGTAGSIDYLFDALVANDTSGTTFIGPVAANQAPTVNVGATQTVVAGSTLTLASTESDPDGDTITGNWTQISGPAVTIANPTNATATVSSLPAGRYVFRRSVSDASLTSTADLIVRSTVAAARPDGIVSNTGNVGVVGAATADAALADESDSTYAQSVNSPSGAVYVYSLAPMTTPTDKSAIKLNVRARYQAGTSGSAKFELLEGATVRKDFGTQTLTSSFADYVLALDLTSANAITDWSNLSVRQTDTAS